MPLTRRTAAPRPGPGDRVRPDGRVVLLEDRSAATARFGRPEQRQEHGARVHAALRQAVARGSTGAPGAGARAAMGRRRARRRSWTIASLVSARGRDPGELARRRGSAGRRRRARPRRSAMSPSAVTRPMTATGQAPALADLADGRPALGPDDRAHPLLRLGDHHLERLQAGLAARDRVEVDERSRSRPGRRSPTWRR